jgi:predicted GIY-YIG superfamily endonuclease
MPFVYMVRCADYSLYVGWTEDVDSRLAMHNEGRGGHYTMRRRPVRLVFVEPHKTVEAARERERQLKSWSSGKKEALIAGDLASLKRLSVSHHSPRYDEP